MANELSDKPETSARAHVLMATFLGDCLGIIPSSGDWAELSATRSLEMPEGTNIQSTRRTTRQFSRVVKSEQSQTFSHWSIVHRVGPYAREHWSRNDRAKINFVIALPAQPAFRFMERKHWRSWSWYDSYAPLISVGPTLLHRLRLLGGRRRK